MSPSFRRQRMASRVPLVVLVVAVVAAAGLGIAGGGVASPVATGGLPGLSPAQALQDEHQLIRQFGLQGTALPAMKAATPVAVPPTTESPKGATPVATGSTGPAPSPAAAPTPAAAPPGFRAELVGLYAKAAQITATASAGITTGVPVQQGPSVARYTQAVDAISAHDLAVVYAATRKVPGFDGTMLAYQQVIAEQAGNPTGVAAAVARAVGSTRATGVAGHASPGTGITFTPATTETTDPSVNIASCPAGAPGGDYGEDSIYAANLVVDAFAITTSFVPDSIVQGNYVLGEGVTITIPDPGWVIIEAAQAAAQVARDTLVWRQAIANDCASNALAADIGVIYDNVASLTALVDSRTTAIDNEEQLLYALVDARNTLILNKIAVIQASLNLELKVTIEEDLLQSGHGAVADFELPSSAGGYLDATPIGVQELVTAALATTQQAGQSVNPAAAQDLASANAALAAHRYKQAFDLYGQTYREIVQ